MHKFFKLLFVLLLICSAFLTGCGSTVPTVKPFKMDIQQGNVVTSKMLLQLKPGMTKSQVKFIMGTPLIVDSFHSNRWDYFYQMRQAGKIKEQRRVMLEFEKDLLARVRGDVVPEGMAGAASGTEAGVVSLPKSIEPKPKEKGLLDKLKFWKGDEKSVVTPETVKPEAPKPEAAPVLEDKPEINLIKPANDALEVNNDEPVGNVLEVPIGGVAPIVEVPTPNTPEPAVAAPVEAPVVEVNKVATPPVEAPKVEPPKALPIKPAEPINTAPVEVVPEVKVKKVEVAPPLPEEELGYFEKMLEKIGF